MDEIERYRQMLNKDPSSQAFVYLAEVYLERKMYAEVIEACLKGLRLRPHDLRGRVLLGLAYLRTGQLNLAEAELLKAREMLEINAVTYQALSELYDETGDSGQAAQYRKLFQTICSTAETELEARELPMATEAKPGEPPQADLEVATVTMAELYAQQGHPEKAVKLYRRILENAPGTEGVEGRLAKLEGEMGEVQEKQNLLTLLESLRDNLGSRAPEQRAPEAMQSGGIDTDRLAVFVQKHFK